MIRLVLLVLLSLLLAAPAPAEAVTKKQLQRQVKVLKRTNKQLRAQNKVLRRQWRASANGHRAFIATLTAEQLWTLLPLLHDRFSATGGDEYRTSRFSGSSYESFSFDRWSF